MAKVVPVLGPSGFASDIMIKADEALSNFYITQRSQTDMFRRTVVSLGNIVAMHGTNEIDIVSELRSTLESYLGRIFDEVTLDVSANTTDSGIHLNISAILRDGNKYADIQHVVTAKDSKIRSIIDLQNEGRPISFGVQN